MANDSNLNIQVTAGGVEETVQKLNTVNDKVTELAAKSESIQALGSSFAKLSVAIAAFATGAIYAAIKTDELRQALDNVGGKGAEQFAKFSTEANKLGLGIEAIAKSAIKLEATGLTNETTRKLIDSVGEAVRKMGGGDAQFTTVINGLEMIASTGVLTNRSLRTIEKTAPELKGAIEQAFGTDNTKKIIAMNLTVEEFMKRIADAAAKMSPHVRTIGDAFNELKNNVLTTMGSLGDTLVKYLKIAEFFDKMSNAIRTAIKAFQDLDPSMRKAIEISLLLIATIGPLILIITALVAVLNPISLIFIGLTVVIGLIIGYWEKLTDRLGYVTYILYGLKTAFEVLLVPILAVGGMILKIAGFLDGGIDGYKSAAKAVDQWTESLLRNISVSAKKAEQISQQTSDLIRQKAAFDKMLADDDSIVGDDKKAGNAGGNKNVITGVGGDKKEKVAKEIKERQANIQYIEDQVSVSQLEADEKAASVRWNNRAKLIKMGLGMTIQQIEKQDSEYRDVKTKLDANTDRATEQLRLDNQKAFWASNPLSPAMVKSINEFNKQLTDLINQGIGQMASALGAGLGKAFEAGNFKDLGKGLLSTMGSLMVQFGELMITTGIGIMAIKASLKSLNPVLAIAGGIALVALGTFVSDSASSMGSGGGGGSYATPSSSGAMSSGQGTDGNLAALQKMSSNSNMMGKVTIKGSDLVLAMQRNNINTRQ